MTLAFAASYASLCMLQGATVAIPGEAGLRRLPIRSSRAWALVPLAAIIAVVFGIRAASGVADGLTYLALVTTPLLAALALGLTARRGKPLLGLAVVPLFALAWAGHSTLPGEAAGVILTALGCVTLAVLLAAITPAGWLKLGIVATSIADTVLVVVQLLERPSARLDAAAPALGLPQFQRALLGDAVMGYGDLFLAALLGAVLVRERPRQPRAARLTAVLALAFGLLFLLVNVLPATVPVAVALILTELGARKGERAGRAS